MEIKESKKDHSALKRWIRKITGENALKSNPRKHTESHISYKVKATANRRMHNKMARASRRINRLRCN